jgi:hypothetical protein
VVKISKMRGKLCIYAAGHAWKEVAHRFSSYDPEEYGGMHIPLVVVWRFSLHAADIKFPPNFAY